MNIRKTQADLDGILSKPGYALAGTPAAIPATPRPELLPVRVKATPRLRQASKGPNKTELAFTAFLRCQYPGADIREQDLVLVIANGCRYQPDNFAPSLPGHVSPPCFWEVKGFAREDAIVKIKVAARIHSWATFYLVTKQRKRDGGGWRIERVLP